MPVITVTAPALPSPGEAEQALAEVAVAVAQALGLTPEDVQVSYVHSVAGVLGRRAVAPWPLVTVHGGARPEPKMRLACDGARRAVARAWAQPEDEVWVQWLVAP